jgi:hypothetical protein
MAEFVIHKKALSVYVVHKSLVDARRQMEDDDQNGKVYVSRIAFNKLLENIFTFSQVGGYWKATERSEPSIQEIGRGCTSDKNI